MTKRTLSAKEKVDLVSWINNNRRFCIEGRLATLAADASKALKTDVSESTIATYLKIVVPERPRKKRGPSRNLMLPMERIHRLERAVEYLLDDMLLDAFNEENL